MSIPLGEDGIDIGLARNKGASMFTNESQLFRSLPTVQES